jgi:hypothetical protein
MEKKQEKFIEKSIKTHGDKYDYSKVQYVNNRTNVSILCKKHNYEFTQKLDNHIAGANCPKCDNDKIALLCKLSLEEFIERSHEKHNNYYDYSQVEYINYKIKVKIICPEHGIYLQTPYNHVRGLKCRRCIMNECKRYRMYGCSKVQIEWLKYLENELSLMIEHHENGGEHRIQNKKRYTADGYCKNINTIFEFQGCYYHGCKTCMPIGINRTCKKTFEELYDKTQKKKEHCINEGYNYIEIWECEWNKIKKTDALLDNYISNLIDINIYLITNNEIII